MKSLADSSPVQEIARVWSQREDVKVLPAPPVQSVWGAGETGVAGIIASVYVEMP